MEDSRYKVLMVVGDCVNMTRRCISTLRKHYGGDVLLVDVSDGYSSENSAIAKDFSCEINRLFPFDTRQFHAHSTALDFALPRMDTEYAILLDNDCFVKSGEWAGMLTEPFTGNGNLVAAGPPRYDPFTISGQTCRLLNTWSTCINVEGIVKTGLSVFSTGRPVKADGGFSFSLDTLDANLILAQMSGLEVRFVPEIEDHCFHIGATTTGNLLLVMYAENRLSFENYFRMLFPAEMENMMGIFYRLMVNAFQTMRYFGDETVSYEKYREFVTTGPGEDIAAGLEKEFKEDTITRLESAMS